MRSKQLLYRQLMMWIVSAGVAIYPYSGFASSTTVIPDKQQLQPAKVSESANGITVVDIRRPNEKGLSHNRYQDLQVGDKGVIFNNSNSIVDTKLAGMLQGNPALVGTKATTILNEVVGTSPTAIRGAIEIAGPAANLMVANPNGIYVNNGIFINTNRAVLTTGIPVLENGELSAFTVAGGTIQVEGKGLDGSSASGTELLAEAVRVNAGIWADNLRAVTGQNKVSMLADEVTTSGDHQGVGLDVAAIGGMYANRITLIGTEKGLGVNIAGTVNALNGTVTVQTDGKVAMSGAVVGTESVSIHAKDMTVAASGIVGGAGTTIQVDTVTNKGVIGSTGQANALSIQAASADNRAGQIVSDGSLHIVTDAVENVAGKIIATENLALQSHVLHNEEGMIATNHQLKLDTDEFTNVAGTLAGNHISVHTSTLLGDKQAMMATGNLDIQTKSDVAFADSKLQANHRISLVSTGAIKNGSTIEAGEELHIEGASLEQTGTLLGKQLTATVTGAMTNTGTINGADVHLTSASLSNLKTGKIYGDTIAIIANQVENSGEYQGAAPVIAARKNLNMGVQTLENRDGALIKAEQNVSIGNKIEISGGVIGVAGRIDNESATIEAGGDLRVDTQEIYNRNLHFSLKQEELGREHIVEVAGSRDGKRYDNLSEHYYTIDEFWQKAIPNNVVAIYNDESDHLSIYGVQYENWWKFNYDRIITGDVVDQTAPGRIIAGSNLYMSGSKLVNDKSEMIAGGLVSIKGSEVEQIDAPGTKTYEDVGTVTSYWRAHRKGKDTTGSRETPYTSTESVAYMVPMTNFGGNKTNTTVRPGAEEYLASPDAAPMKLSSSSLYTENPDSTASYYMETDPMYTNKKSFISSDYFLYQLRVDPSRTAKRLGDGYYEMQLVKDQIFQLTGQRYLGSHESDEAEYQALMDAAARYAASKNLQIGVALTEDEQEQLQEDMVWLVEKAVLLPSGQIVTALVPQVYVAEKEEHIPHVAIISGRQVDLEATDELLNSGTIVAGDIARLSATNIHNHHGRIKGNVVDMTATNSLSNLGGTIEATKALSLQAGKDITLASTSALVQEENHQAHVIDSVSKLRVTGENSRLYVQAGNDVTLQGALVEGKGTNSTVTIQAGKDIHLDTLSTSSSRAIISDAKNTRKERNTVDVGSTIASEGSISMLAGQDVVAKSATIAATGDVALTAGRDMQFDTGTQSVGLVEDHYHVGKTGGGGRQVNQSHDEVEEVTQLGNTLSGKNVTLTSGKDIRLAGTSLVAGEKANITARDMLVTGVTDTYTASGTAQVKKSGLLSKKQTDSAYQVHKETVQKSAISAKDIMVQSRENTKLIASDVVAKDAVNIVTGKQITLDTLQDKQEVDTYSKTKKSGLSLSGLGFSFGTEKLKETDHTVQMAPVGSTIATLEGKTTITAGHDVLAKMAAMSGKEGVTITGENVTLTGDYASYEGHHTFDYSKSGLTVSLGGTVSSALQSASTFSRKADNRDNRALSLLEYGEAARELKEGLDDVRAYQSYVSSIPKEAPASALQQKDVLKDQLVHATISIGSQSMNSSGHIKETEYQSGSVTSEHGAVVIQAQGKDSLQGNLTAIGERIQGKTVTLGADGSVELLAAKNERQSEEDTKQKGWSVGVHVGVTGLSGGEIGAYQGKSEGLTTRTTHTGTAVIGEEKAQITAGKDVSVIGSKIIGNQVALTAGNHLTMTSLQDTEQYQKDSKASGFSIATDKKGLSDVGAYGTTGKANSKYASVTDQAGIYAGTEGFQVTVGDTTHLTGAVISSTADKEKNSLTTGILVMENVYNEADFSDKTVGLNYTWSRRYDELKGKAKEESGLSPAEQTVLNNQYNKMGLLPELSPGSKGEASSVTTSAISDGKIVATKGAVDVSQINRNTANSLNSLDKIFDKKKVEEKQELAKLFAKNVNEAIHIISKNKGWDDGSPEKIALHTFFAGIEGQLSGNGFSSGALAGGVNELVAHQLLETLGTNHPDLAQMASAALGYATNKLAGKEGLAGAAIAQYGTKWNANLDYYQQHGSPYNDTIAQLLRDNIDQGKMDGTVAVLKSAIDIIDLPTSDKYDSYIASPAIVDNLNRAAREVFNLNYSYNSNQTTRENILRLLELQKNSLPSRDIVVIEGGFGDGFGGELNVGLGTLALKAASHLSFASNRNYMTIESNASAGLAIVKQLAIGVEYNNSYNLRTKEDTNLASINVIKPINSYSEGGVSPWGTLENDKTAKVGAGIYFGAGGEANVLINLTAAYERVFGIENDNDKKKELEKFIESKK